MWPYLKQYLSPDLVRLYKRVASSTPSTLYADFSMTPLMWMDGAFHLALAVLAVFVLILGPHSAHLLEWLDSRRFPEQGFFMRTLRHVVEKGRQSTLDQLHALRAQLLWAILSLLPSRYLRLRVERLIDRRCHIKLVFIILLAIFERCFFPLPNLLLLIIDTWMLMRIARRENEGFILRAKARCNLQAVLYGGSLGQVLSERLGPSVMLPFGLWVSLGTDEIRNLAVLVGKPLLENLRPITSLAVRGDAQELHYVAWREEQEEIERLKTRNVELSFWEKVHDTAIDIGFVILRFMMKLWLR